jgi:hypothetical protein
MPPTEGTNFAIKLSTIEADVLTLLLIFVHCPYPKERCLLASSLGVIMGQEQNFENTVEVGSTERKVGQITTTISMI